MGWWTEYNYVPSHTIKQQCLWDLLNSWKNFNCFRWYIMNRVHQRGITWMSFSFLENTLPQIQVSHIIIWRWYLLDRKGSRSELLKEIKMFCTRSAVLQFSTHKATSKRHWPIIMVQISNLKQLRKLCITCTPSPLSWFLPKVSSNWWGCRRIQHMIRMQTLLDLTLFCLKEFNEHKRVWGHEKTLHCHYWEWFLSKEKGLANESLPQKEFYTMRIWRRFEDVKT